VATPFGEHKTRCDNMRDSIWSAPNYSSYEEEMSRMEEGYSVFNDAIILEIPGTTWQAKLDHCAACKCCPRHQEKRPRSLVHWIDSDPRMNRQVVHECGCDCRHLARFICRQVPRSVVLPNPRQSPTLCTEDPM